MSPNWPRILRSAGCNIRIAEWPRDKPKGWDVTDHFRIGGSVEELYASRDAFLRAVDEAADALAAQRFLLPDDSAVVRARLADTWDWIQAH